MQETYDIVVGISTRNVKTTIKNVMHVVDAGLSKYFPKSTALILISDGFSTDGTRQVASKTKTKAAVKISLEKGIRGKGSAVRNIFEHSVKYDAKAVVMVDGDLENIKPTWIKNLAKPIFDRFDLTVPLYLRDKDDAVITNHLVYPLTKVLYRVDIRQPIGGEYGLSGRFVKTLLGHPLFPDRFGIDIFITTVAVAENFKIAQARLGKKEHESTRSYKNPDTVLVPMFNQVMTEVFKLIDYYKDYIKKVKDLQHVKTVGPRLAVEAEDVMIDVISLIEELRLNYKKFLIKGTLPKDVERELLEVCEFKNFIFRSHVWVKTVYYIIIKYLKKKEIEKDLNLLRLLWKAWFAAYAIKTAHMTDREAEKYIDDTVKEFFKHRNVLVKSL